VRRTVRVAEMRLTNEKNAEKAKLQKDHAKELSRLQKEHKREVEVLFCSLHTFTN